MYITLISACHQRALKRTRAIIDSYAIRVGERTWMTPITDEGMQEMRGLLRRVATRQTAVACYRNQGARQMVLLWIVGSRRQFGQTGHYPAGTRTMRRAPPPPWVQAACILARSAGLGHDVGKTYQYFCQKLAYSVAGKAPPSGPDPARHEWLSMRLLQEMRAGRSFKEAWNDELLDFPPRTGFGRRAVRTKSLKDGLASAQDALDYLIVTHHKLLGPERKKGNDASSAYPDASAHVRRDRMGPDSVVRCSTEHTEFAQQITKDIDKNLARILAMPDIEKSELFWRALVWPVRVALILADHEVSSCERKGHCPHDPYVIEPPIFANTMKGEAGARVYNQTLGWHLDNVGRTAANRLYQMSRLRLPSLSTEAIDRLVAPTPSKGANARFAWQNRAAHAAQKLADKHPDRPLLILNIAATGSGKTRMNARLACTINRRPRFAVALNLRTLTLQTGDALREMGVGSDELSAVIGDRPTAALHEWSRTALDEAGDGAEEAIEVSHVAVGGEVELPGWMSHLLKPRQAWKKIIGTPVLVSTIDFLVNAGEPGRQGNHVSAFLRLLDSDLILDEIDSYEPKALVAVLRVIQTAALLGRHVICSSATLAEPVADAVRKAFASGARMHASLTGQSGISEALIIDDRAAPHPVPLDDGFQPAFREYTNQMLTKGGARVCRMPYLQGIAHQSEPSWREAVLDATERLHKDHGWAFRKTQKRVSFGLVRVANIRTAIPLARFLSKRLPHAQICCYHSQDWRLQRFHKERRLDFLLSRKKDHAHRIENDPEIQAIIDRSTNTDIPFVVVATPVEEIGRDHDFDWAALEPSGTHSLVQAAGRVNRHRLESITRPNIAILQYNARWARDEKPTFSRPGLESEHVRYSTNDLEKLLDWSRLNGRELDARLRFDRAHIFTREDERILSELLAEPVKTLCCEDQHKSAWMTAGFYQEYALRTNEPVEHWRLNLDDDGNERFLRFNPQDHKSRDAKHDDSLWRRAKIERVISRVTNDWLALPVTDLLEQYAAAEIAAEHALTCEIHVHTDTNRPLYWDRSFGLLAESR
ncbi:type I-F CRISPR-associated helicase Cas3f [Thiorhodovibrio frisius]|uniref:CRISPR-associated helicase Cas3, subtype I-F/YPEST n=1 Tax=Thiorhodovibrio frisius TaxID=631362 RepID=H8Z7X1_9GAMM|nr:type I-F CRISPR-associated helicase Cas3f [Thiorhodovibrio frisius]EIC20983.1 CRISPR-associated helicase Cas3, subtype I-F/YPEST [Thiorhodovibrio frisius]WPL22039.1 CRISPR-associated nuclease/helicase Cas3 subtype I-F/YPEST [Thiorhodovibrio frisius]